MMKATIVGATGLVGSALGAALVRAGHEVTALVRPSSRISALAPGVTPVVMAEDMLWKPKIAEADVIFNLAGESIGAQRWSPEFKQRLEASRIVTTRLIVEALAETCGPNRTPPVLINASAVGYYGDCADEVVTEAHAPGGDFLANLCVKWEAEALRASEFGARVVLMRMGHVLARGGLVQKMLYPLPVPISPFKLGLGGPLGNGRQWMPWAHIDDVVGPYIFAATNPDVTGPVNLATPNPVTNRDFARALGRAVHRPAVLPVPALVLRLVLGEFAGSILGGQRAVPGAAISTGYAFKFADIDEALKDLV